MSKNGLEPGATGAITVHRHDVPEPWHWSSHTHTEHQFLWGPSGTVAVETDEHNWLVPPTLGLWIPSNTPHAVDGVRPARVYCLYLDPDTCPIRWTAPTAVAVGSFLREAVVRLDDPTLTADERARTEAVMYDVLRPVTVSSIRVPTPADERLRTITKALMANPADDRGLLEWGNEVGASVRTLTRLFLADTGMTFAQWRLQVRLRAALAPLARGVNVSTVARAIGYSNPSSFVHAFHRITGQTPGAYFASANPGGTLPEQLDPDTR